MSAHDVMNGGEYALETDEISKHFGAVRAVDGLSLSIPRRGMTSIVGPNGSGEINAGKPAERDAAAGWRDGHN